MNSSPQPRRTIVLVYAMHSRRIGGIEVQLRELAGRLTSLGWQLVVCFQQPPDPEVRKYLDPSGVQFEEFPDAWNNSWRASRDLFRILRRYRPSILHLQFTPFLGLHPWMARLGGVKTIVLTDHTSRPEGFKAVRQAAWKRTAGQILHSPVSFAVEVSDYTRNTIATLGTFPQARLRRIYNGVDTTGSNEETAAAGMTFRTRHGIPRDRFVITQVSQIAPEKGIPDVLKAAKLALAKHPGLHFVFAGAGKCLAEYVQRARASGISDRVTWTGLVTNPVTEGVFAATDISCQASRWEEAFGLSIAEAMSFSKPVVATRVGGIPEVVTDGESGFLVPRRDPEALADKFVLLARDAALCQRMGRAGRARVEALFDVRENVNTLLGLYGL